MGSGPALFLPASGGLRGTVRVPGDKSVSHRAVLLGAVNTGRVTIRGFLHSADTMATVAAVRGLGVPIIVGDNDLIIEGRGWEGLSEPDDVIDVANSGTLIRLLPGLVASTPHLCVLTGDASIRRRPMRRILEPLARMGATVAGRQQNSLPPIAIRGGELRGCTHELQVASAQVKSCLLLAGLRASGPTTVIEPAPSRDHTERMVQYAGGRVTSESLPDGRGIVTVEPMRELHMEHVSVPGDISSAAFFLTAATLVPGSHVIVEDVGLNPSRIGLLTVLTRMGARLQTTPAQMLGPEPVGTVSAHAAELVATDVGPDEVPGLIDELPLFLLAAARARGTSHLHGAEELRAKESDRLAVMASFLRSLGVRVEERPDGMDVHGRPEPWQGGEVSAHGDHRMAMVGAVAGAASLRGVHVDDVGCMAVSFPGFTALLQSLGGDWIEEASA
jgi:3-phosphoshikimate 1-carboxyvinyltransferase